MLNLIFTTCTNSGLLPSTVLHGIELEILEPLHWLMLWEWTRAWQHYSNYPTPYWPISKVLWAWFGCPEWWWSLFGPLVLWQLVLVTTVTFLTVWALVVEAIPTSMSCQYTSNRNMGFGHRLCCYDNSNGNYQTTILNHFASVRISCTNFSHMICVEAQKGIICHFWICHCHSNRNILSPILLTCSDGISLC